MITMMIDTCYLGQPPIKLYMDIARLSAKCNQQPAFIYAALIFVSSFRNEIAFFFVCGLSRLATDTLYKGQ